MKTKVLVMSNGEWLAPGSVEDDRYWDAFVDISSDNGQHWQRVDIPIAHHQGGQRSMKSGKAKGRCLVGD